MRKKDGKRRGKKVGSARDRTHTRSTEVELEERALSTELNLVH